MFRHAGLVRHRHKYQGDEDLQGAILMFLMPNVWLVGS